jgi:hypothetical protein
MGLPRLCKGSRSTIIGPEFIGHTLVGDLSEMHCVEIEEEMPRSSLNQGADCDG